MAKVYVAKSGKLFGNTWDHFRVSPLVMNDITLAPNYAKTLECALGDTHIEGSYRPVRQVYLQRTITSLAICRTFYCLPMCFTLFFLVGYNSNGHQTAMWKKRVPRSPCLDTLKVLSGKCGCLSVAICRHMVMLSASDTV